MTQAKREAREGRRRVPLVLVVAAATIVTQAAAQAHELRPVDENQILLDIAQSGMYADLAQRKQHTRLDKQRQSTLSSSESDMHGDLDLESLREDSVQDLLAADNTKMGRDDVQKAIARGVAVDKQDVHGRTALMKASHEGNGALVLALLEHGANPNLQDENKVSALLAAVETNQTEVVRALLDGGASPDLVSKANTSALMVASDLGFAHLVRLLLRHRAAVDLQDEDGSTALMWATASNHSDVVRALLDSGANTRLVNSRGLSALDMAQPAAAQLFPDHTPPTKQHTSVEGQDSRAGAVTEAVHAGRTSQAELPGQRHFTREYVAS